MAPFWCPISLCNPIVSSQLLPLRLAFYVLLGFVRVVSAQSGGLALTHVTIIDPGVGKPQQDMTILAHGQELPL
jgi:hypothetical protein